MVKSEKNNKENDKTKCPSGKEIFIAICRAAFLISFLLGNGLYLIIITFGYANHTFPKIMGVCFYVALISSGFMAFMTHDFDGAGNNSGLPL